MPSKKAVVQAAARASKQAAVIPEPPSDLWEQMDEVNRRNKMHAMTTQPAGTFTATQYGKKYGITHSPAKARLRRLVELGEIEVAGIGLCNVHYYRPKRGNP